MTRSGFVALAGRPIYIATRRLGAGSDLGSALAKRGLAIEVGEVHWNVPVVEAVVVNCTPLGMHGEEIPAVVLALAGGLFDMAYGPVATPAVGTLRSMGLPVVEGLDLLVAQAARSFRIWTGVAPPLAAMTKAAKNP